MLQPARSPSDTHRGQTLAAMALVAMMMTAALGCSSQQTCNDLRSRYQTTLQQQGQLQNGQTKGTSHNLMATQIHADALGDMVEAVLERQGTLSHRISRKPARGTRLDMTLTWTRLSFALTPECNDCIALTSGLSAQINARVMGVPIPVDRAQGKLIGHIPLYLKATPAGSELSTDLSAMTLQQLDLKVPGLPNELTRLILPMARDAAQEVLKTVGGPVSLARWKPMTLPGGKLTIVARELATLADHNTIWVGWGADLPITADVQTLRPTASLRPGESAAVSFAGPALTPLMRAMQGKGGIPNRLNSDLKPDPNGDITITIDRVTPTTNGLATRFSAWNLPSDGGRCYRIDLEATTQVTVTPPQPQARQIGARQGSIQVSMDDMRVVATEGDDTLVRLGLWLRSVFVEETLQAQTRLLAAHEFDLGGAGTVGVDLQRATINPEGVTLIL
ncbi:MAG: hypothetical protein AAFS10_21840, partial [Myxococcota bacterium]